MSEKAPTLTLDYDKRPLGRFLLSRIGESFEQKFDHTAAYEFAKNFSTQFKDELHERAISSIAKVDMNDEEVSVLHKQDFLWIEFDQQFAESQSYVWKFITSREQYDLTLNDGFFYVTKYEMSEMNAVLRRTTSSDQELASQLQMLIEESVNGPVFQESITQRKFKRTEQRNVYNDLMERSYEKVLTWGERRTLDVLQKTKDLSIFDTGFVDRRGQLPLIGRHDWKPVPLAVHTPTPDKTVD